jgi:hypothetical protein
MRILLKADTIGIKFHDILRKACSRIFKTFKQLFIFIFILLCVLIRDIRTGLEFVIYVLFGGHGSLHRSKSHIVADKGTVSRRVGAGCGPSDAGGAATVPRSGAGESARRLQRPLPGTGGSALSSRQQYCLQH